MNLSAAQPPIIAIACGGTGGHLFPGLAVAEQLRKLGCTVALLISPKDVDQQAVKSALERRAPSRQETESIFQQAETVLGVPLEVHTLPAVALQNRNYFSFGRSFGQSWRAAGKIFQARPPQAVLAMGGFTAAPPILAARRFGAKTFLHESNSIPGRANRFLARLVDEAFIGFPEAGSRLKTRKVTTTGTPVRSRFQPRDAAECRAALGFDPQRPVVLVMGGSQGASGLNEMIMSALPLFAQKNWQWLHLTGPNDFESVKAAYAARGLNAVIQPFLAEMDLALGAATVSVSRSGASSLAEIAAMRLPSLLVPYPTAADNHQFTNARAFEKTGAARLLEQRKSSPEEVAAVLTGLVGDETARATMQAALARWHAPRAAEQIAEIILQAIAQPAKAAQSTIAKRGCGHAHGSTRHAH